MDMDVMILKYLINWFLNSIPCNYIGMNDLSHSVNSDVHVYQLWKIKINLWVRKVEQFVANEFQDTGFLEKYKFYFFSLWEMNNEMQMLIAFRSHCSQTLCSNPNENSNCK